MPLPELTSGHSGFFLLCRMVAVLLPVTKFGAATGVKW